jgi:hypothetical protein
MSAPRRYDPGTLAAFRAGKEHMVGLVCSIEILAEAEPTRQPKRQSSGPA